MKYFLTIFFSVVIVYFSFGQCKIQKTNKKLNKHIDSVLVLNSKPKTLFNKYSRTCAGFFAKDIKNNYYLALYFYRGARRVDIFPDTPVFINLENETVIELLTVNYTESKMYGISVVDTVIKPYYSVSKEQLHQFEESPVQFIRIYFNSEQDITDTYVDEIGRYYEFEVKADKYQDNLQSCATSILQSGK